MLNLQEMNEEALGVRVSEVDHNWLTMIMVMERPNYLQGELT